MILRLCDLRINKYPYRKNSERTRMIKFKTLLFFLFINGMVVLSGCSSHDKKQMEAIPPLPEKFTEFTLKAECVADPLIIEIKKESESRDSILHLLASYIDISNKDAKPDSPALRKMAKLFSCGQVKDRVEGHFYGITAVLKKGDHPFGGFLNQLWGATLGDVSPWDGKTFNAVTPDKLTYLTDGFEKGNFPTFLGINCFKEYKTSFLNMASMSVLTFWLKLKDVPKQEKQAFGYGKKGGLFIAKRATSIDPDNFGKEVFQLNYRWKNLNNPPPLKYLIDEIVQIAEGLFIGPLFFATEHLLEEYDPKLNPAEYKYENFGYFILMDEDWKDEKKRLFP